MLRQMIYFKKAIYLIILLGSNSIILFCFVFSYFTDSYALNFHYFFPLIFLIDIIHYYSLLKVILTL